MIGNLTDAGKREIKRDFEKIQLSSDFPVKERMMEPQLLHIGWVILIGILGGMGVVCAWRMAIKKLGEK